MASSPCQRVNPRYHALPVSGSLPRFGRPMKVARRAGAVELDRPGILPASCPSHRPRAGRTRSRINRVGTPSAIPSRRSRASSRLRTSCPAGPCASTSATWTPELQTWPASVTSVRRATGLPLISDGSSAAARASSSLRHASTAVGRRRRDDQVDRHPHRRGRQVKVGEDRLRQLLVRDDDGVVLRVRSRDDRQPIDST